MSEKHYTEWPQEEKDELARQRMEAMAKKNEELKKRHAEVEADRRNAELLNSSVNTIKVKRGSLSEDPCENVIGNSGRMKSISGSNVDSHHKFQSESEGNRSKQHMARKGQQPKMSVTKQKLYEEWKAERQQIDDDRNARQKDSVGSYRREWDKDKLEAEPEKQNTSLHYYKIPKWASNDEYQRNNRESYRGHDRGIHYKNRNQSFGPKYDSENTYDRGKKEKFDEKFKGKPFRKGESANPWYDNEDSSFSLQKFNIRGCVFQKDSFVKRGPGNRGGAFRNTQRYYNTGYSHNDSDCQRRSKDAAFGFASSENTSFSSRSKGSFTSKNDASNSIERKHANLSSGWSDGEDEIPPIQKTKPKNIKRSAGVTDSSGTWSGTENDFDNCQASGEKHVRNIPNDSGNWSDSESLEFCERGHSQHKEGHTSERITKNSAPCKSFIHNSQNPVVDIGNTDNRGDKPIPPPLDPSLYHDCNPKNDSYNMRNDRRNRVFNNSVSETNCNIDHDSSQFHGRFHSHTHETNDPNQESWLRGKGSHFASSNFSSSRNRPEYWHKEFDDRHNHGSHRGRSSRGKSFQDKGSFQRPFQREPEDFDYQKNKRNSQNINRGEKNNFQQRVKDYHSDKRFNERPNLQNQGLRAEESNASKDGSSFKKNSNFKILDSDGNWGNTDSFENDGNWGNTENTTKDDLILKFPEGIDKIGDSGHVCKDNKNNIFQEEIRKEDDLWKENEGNSIQQIIDDNLADTENVGYLNCESSATCNSLVNIEKKGTSQCEVEHFVENDVACSESHDGSWTTISGADSVNEQIEEEYIDIDEGHEYQYSKYLRESVDDRLISTCEIQDVIRESNKNEITELHSCDKPNEQTVPNSCDNISLKDLCRDINLEHTSSSILDSCMNTSFEPSSLSHDHLEGSCSNFHGITLSGETNVEFRSSDTEVDNGNRVHEPIKSCDIICDEVHVFSGAELETPEKTLTEVLKKSDLLLNMKDNIDVEENCCLSSTIDESVENKTEVCAQNINFEDDHCSDSKELNVIESSVTVIDKGRNISLSPSTIEDDIIGYVNVESKIELSVNAEGKKSNSNYVEMGKEILLENIDSTNMVDCHSLPVELVDISLTKKSVLKDDDYSHFDDSLNAKCHLESVQSVSLDGKEKLKCKAEQNRANCLNKKTEMSSISAYKKNENTEELISSVSEKEFGLKKVGCNHSELDTESGEFTEVSVLHNADDVEFHSQLRENEEKQEFDAIYRETEYCSSGIDTQEESLSQLKLSVDDNMTVSESTSYHESAQNVSPNEISVEKVPDDSVNVIENFDCFQ